MSNIGNDPWNKGKGKGWIQNGYRRLIRKGRCVMEHRIVMEEHLGRNLEPWELVHHKDGNRLNNAIENLEIQTWPDHTRQHAKGRKLSYETKRSLAAFAYMREELERVRSVNSALVAALEAFSDAYEAQWGDLDVWLDFMEKANVEARKALSDARNLSAGMEGGRK